MSRVFVNDLPKKLTEPELRQHFSVIDTITECSLRFTERGQFRRFAFVGFKAKDAADKAVKELNNTFIGMTKIKVSIARDLKDNKPRTDNRTDNRTDKNKGPNNKSKMKTKYKNSAAPSDDLVLQTGRLFLRNLPYDCNSEDIEKLFSPFGNSEVHLVNKSKDSKNNTGTCFVKFSDPEEAMKAYKELDGTDFQGRLLHIMPAHPPINEKAEAQTWKQKKEEAKKEPKPHTWNTLFVGSDAATNVIAERLNISKSDLILNAGKESVAARVTLGEAQIVSEIKEFLLANGVSLDSFGQADGPRSKTIILVKNLNAFTTEQSLHTIFERYGTIVRLVVPPCGLSALVEFGDPVSAKKAFEKLSNQTVDHTILYLEWAPVNVFSRPASKSNEEKPVEKEAENEDEQEEKKEDTTSKAFVAIATNTKKKKVPTATLR